MQIIAQVLKERPENMFSLSVSKAKTFDQCKAKYKYCYIDKLPRKEFDFHIFGKFLHEVLEKFHKKTILDPYLDFKKELYMIWDEVLPIWAPKLTEDQIKEGKAILDEYKYTLTEEGVPNVLSVEKSFFIDLNGKVLLNGFIDRVQKDPDDMIHVLDYKTTKDKRYLKDFFQLQTYAYSLMLEDPSIKRVRSSFVMLRHGFDYITEEYTRNDAKTVEGKFLKYLSEIEQEKLWRPNPQFLCKYCDYIDTCGEGNRYMVKRGVVKPNKDFGLSKW